MGDKRYIYFFTKIISTKPNSFSHSFNKQGQTPVKLIKLQAGNIRCQCSTNIPSSPLPFFYAGSLDVIIPKARTCVFCLLFVLFYQRASLMLFNPTLPKAANSPPAWEFSSPLGVAVDWGVTPLLSLLLSLGPPSQSLTDFSWKRMLMSHFSMNFQPLLVGNLRQRCPWFTTISSSKGLQIS